METLIRMLLIMMLAALPFKSMAMMKHTQPPAAVSEHAHCMEHTADEATPSSGNQCEKHCDCCLGGGLPARTALGFPQNLPDTLTAERESSFPTFITSAPERPPRAHLA